MTNASMVSIPWAQPEFWGNEQNYVTQALQSTWISGGHFLDRFEKEFAQYCGKPFAVSASNGTTAIHMAYLGLGIKPGDEVIVPGFSFLAGANIALLMNAIPVFADVDPNSWCVTAEAIEKCITPRTRLILPVHTYGNVCLMDDIISLGKMKNFAVVEDVAEAFTSRYKGKLAGTIAGTATFSFQATKIITTGEGGMVLTDDRELLDRMTLYRSHGMLKTRYLHEVPGHNFRLTNMQAALGCAQMEHLDEIISHRRRVHNAYKKALAGVEGIELQYFPPDVDPVLWALALRLEPSAFPKGRDNVMRSLKEIGIESRPGFYDANQVGLYGKQNIPVSEDIARQVISLPTYPSLKEEQIEYISTHLKHLRR
jgi:perosamine synthetase